MAGRHTAVVGVYSSVPDADRAVYELLRRASFIVEVSVLSAGAGATLLHPWINARLVRGASGGSMAGAAVGGTLVWLASTGIITIPLFAPFVAAGPVMATLAGAVAGAMAGSLIGALAGAVRSEAEPPPAQPAPPQNILLAVHCGNQNEVASALTVLQETGAAEIEEKPEPDDPEPPVIH